MNAGSQADEALRKGAVYRLRQRRTLRGWDCPDPILQYIRCQIWVRLLFRRPVAVTSNPDPYRVLFNITGDRPVGTGTKVNLKQDLL